MKLRFCLVILYDPKASSCAQNSILTLFSLYQLDLMTEKWVIVAAVEVMLRFPLMPGEDPSARCVSSKKCQPSGGWPLTAPRRHGDQEERWDECQGVTWARSGEGVREFPLGRWCGL